MACPLYHRAYSGNVYHNIWDCKVNTFPTRWLLIFPRLALGSVRLLHGRGGGYDMQRSSKELKTGVTNDPGREELCHLAVSGENQVVTHENACLSL